MRALVVHAISRRTAPLVFAAAVLVSLLVACGERRAAPRPDNTLHIVVSIAPLKGIVDPLLAPASGRPGSPRVSVLVPVGALEHGYEIPSSMIAEIMRAGVVVRVGLGLEPELERILHRDPSASRRDVSFADAVGVQAGEPADRDGHVHVVDPHLWLDPVLVARFVPAVYAAITEAARERGAPLDPGAAGVSPADALVARVNEVDARYRERLAPFKGREIITAHAAWGRLAARYGLEQVPLAGLEASEPSPAAIARAVEVIRARGAGAVFVEPQINPATANRIAQLTGVRVHRLDPLGDGDWFKMMSANLDELVAGLSEGGSAAPEASPQTGHSP